MHQAHPPTLPSLPISSPNSNVYNSPNTNATLQLAAQNGPVIVLNISARRSDAIIVQKAGNPLLLPLPDTHPNQISNIPSEFTQAVNSLRIGNGVEDRKSSRPKFNAILRSLCDYLVWPVVQKLKETGVPICLVFGGVLHQTSPCCPFMLQDTIATTSQI
ncbi:hypothetical protein FRC03_005442 [Tulasnella sp. 419]|nr:hypothetical protein FRC03_005442 [Tulasnella sp. 419]